MLVGDTNKFATHKMASREADFRVTIDCQPLLARIFVSVKSKQLPPQKIERQLVGRASQLA